MEVTAIDYCLNDGVVMYNFQVRFAGLTNWVVSKTYDDFVGLNEVLEKHYGALCLPYLTGQVRPWARNSSATALARLPKLECYLNEALSSSSTWSPRLHEVRVRNPLDPSATMEFNSFLFAFLEVKPHLPQRPTAAVTPQRPPPKPEVAVAPRDDPRGIDALSHPASVSLSEPAGMPSAASCPTRADAGGGAGGTPRRITVAVDGGDGDGSNEPVRSEARGALDGDATATSVGTPQGHGHTLVSRDAEHVVAQSEASRMLRKAPAPSARLTRPGDGRPSPVTSGLHMEVTLQPIQPRARRFNTELLALAAEASTVTSQIEVHIKDFTIFHKDHILYHVHLNLYGHHWIVSKRYSEFVTLYEQMVEIYGDSVVPSIASSRVPPWRKVDPQTGQLRQSFFGAYLQDLVTCIDQWEPTGLLANFDLSRRVARGDVARLTVYVNQLLFDFFDLASQVGQLSGDVAAQAVEDHQATLSDEVKMAFDRKQLQEKRERMRNTVASNAEALPALPEADLTALLEGISTLADDRDIMSAFKHLLRTGRVDARAQALYREEMMNDDNDGGPTLDVFNSRNAKVGLTASQVARITEQLFFNDTKIDAIVLFAGVLINIDDLQSVFDTLWINWDATRVDVERILSRM